MSAQREREHVGRPATTPKRPLPPLETGDRLSRAEFERRYEAMPHVKKAELIEGVVYMGSPVSFTLHGKPDNAVNVWLGVYSSLTPGTEAGANSTTRLDLDNEPQPDALLRIAPERGGRTRTVDEYVEGAPELIAEIAASSVSYDLHQKLQAYRRNGVREYLVWRTRDEEVDWFVLRDGEYARLAPDAEGILRSEGFPGLWLDPAALLRGDLARVLAVVQTGAATPEHAAFVEALAKGEAGKSA